MKRFCLALLVLFALAMPALACPPALSYFGNFAYSYATVAFVPTYVVPQVCAPPPVAYVQPAPVVAAAPCAAVSTYAAPVAAPCASVSYAPAVLAAPVYANAFFGYGASSRFIVRGVHRQRFVNNAVIVNRGVQRQVVRQRSVVRTRVR